MVRHLFTLAGSHTPAFSNIVVKNILIIASLVLAGVSALGQGLSLSSGQSYTFTFNSMALVGPNTFPDALYDAGFSFPGSTGFSADSTVSLSLFDASSPDSPFQVADFQGPTNTFPTGFQGGEESDGVIGEAGQASPIWQNQQGTLVITVVSGSLTLDGMDARTVIDGNLYEATASVPEPSELVLGALGMSLPVLLFRRRFYRNRVSV
jgi:hypothetical protein